MVVWHACCELCIPSICNMGSVRAVTTVQNVFSLYIFSSKKVSKILKRGECECASVHTNCIHHVCT